jgi:short-subunit dehydrogenase
LRGSGVKVITICPGYIATALTANNPYPMPFLMSADQAAGKIAALIARGREFAVIPWQMAVIARLMRLVPNWLYDRLAANRKHKPRRGA